MSGFFFCGIRLEPVEISSASRTKPNSELAHNTTSSPNRLRWIDAVVQALDAARAQAKSARGEARDALLARLSALDASLLAALRSHCDDQTRRQLEAEADEELRPYRARMPAEAYRDSHGAAVDRLLRERARMPTISYE